VPGREKKKKKNDVDFLECRELRSRKGKSLTRYVFEGTSMTKRNHTRRGGAVDLLGELGQEESQKKKEGMDLGLKRPGKGKKNAAPASSVLGAVGRLYKGGAGVSGRKGGGGKVPQRDKALAKRTAHIEGEKAEFIAFRGRDL